MNTNDEQRFGSAGSRARAVITTIPGVALVLFGILSTNQARAGCSDFDAPHTALSAGKFTPAYYRPGELAVASLHAVSSESSAPIVGLWEFEFRLKGDQNGLRDGTLFDWGLATWHADGTEIQFSAGRPPSAGDVCMGVWKQVGYHTFKLHHIALGLTPPDASGSFIGPAIIRATVTLDSDSDTYSGSYSVSLYSGTPDNGTEFNENGSPMVTFSGNITARRVNP